MKIDLYLFLKLFIFPLLFLFYDFSTFLIIFIELYNFLHPPFSPLPSYPLPGSPCSQFIQKDLYFLLCTKINTKKIKDLNVICETQKIHEQIL